MCHTLCHFLEYAFTRMKFPVFYILYYRQCGNPTCCAVVAHPTAKDVLHIAVRTLNTPLRLRSPRSAVQNHQPWPELLERSCNAIAELLAVVRLQNEWRAKAPEQLVELPRYTQACLLSQSLEPYKLGAVVLYR